MSDNRIFYIIFALMITAGSIIHISEAQEDVTVSTASGVYYSEDHIVVFGNVNTILQDLPITVQIYYDTTLVDVGQVSVALDGTFVKSFSAAGPMWQNEGTYTVRAFYTETMIAGTTFDFYNQVIDSSSSAFPINIPDSGTFDIGYTIRGGDVENIEMDMERNSILIQTSMDTNGNLVLKLPRESFDAQSDDTDENFIVLVSKENTSAENFANVEYEEIGTSSEYRTIRITLEEGDKWVEVIGTYVIPEFGSIAIIILVVAVSSAIIISKNRLSIRYN